MTGILTPEDITLDGDLIRMGENSVMIRAFISGMEVEEEAFILSLHEAVKLRAEGFDLPERTAELTVFFSSTKPMVFGFPNLLSAQQVMDKIAAMVNGTYITENSAQSVNQSQLNERGDWFRRGWRNGYVEGHEHGQLGSVARVTLADF